MPGAEARASGRTRLVRWMGVLAVVAACGRDGGRTVHELRIAIAQYRTGAEPTAARVEALFARLDGDIAAVRREGAQADGAARAALDARAAALDRERAALRAAFADARTTRWPH